MASLFMILGGLGGLATCFLFGDKWKNFFDAKRQEELIAQRKILSSAARALDVHDEALKRFDD